MSQYTIVRDIAGDGGLIRNFNEYISPRLLSEQAGYSDEVEMGMWHRESGSRVD